VKGVTILGATGSIGINTLDVMSRYPEKYRIVALTANSEIERLYRQCQTFHPEYAVMANELAAEQLAEKLRSDLPDIKVLSGVEGLEQVAALEQVNIVMAAIVGAAGLLPTLSAARSGKRILLANKEALVVAGRIFMDEVRNNQAELLPIDSEHNAIFQCMPANFEQGLSDVGVRRIMLTSSGGPFLHMPASEFSTITPEQACAHPNWAMGKKISVDSATMMNKGLEVIEACVLFNTTPDKVQVVVHPQSVIHSMVEYIDGTVLAQLGAPDMRIPIAHALAWPERIKSGAERLDLFEIARLDFEAPDFERFPCLAYAYEAASQDSSAAVIMNAANEVAVGAFLEHNILFSDIPLAIRRTLSELTPKMMDSIDDILCEDQRARGLARDIIKEIKSDYCK